MASLELDPILRKGIKLLHSKNKESADQLKALLEETLHQRQGKSHPNIKDPFTFRRESPIPRTKQGSPINIVHAKTENKRDLSGKGRDDEGHISKRPRLDSPHTVLKSHTPSPTSSLKSESSSWSRKSDESDSDADPNMNELAMQIGINCSVCKSFEQTSGNQLVECQECYSLYHQECHTPPVSHQEVTDPRLVWYCTKCTITLKKQTTVVSSGSGGGTQALGSVRSAPASSSNSKSNSSISLSSSRPSPSKSSGLSRQSPFANLSSVSSKTVGSSSVASNSSIIGSGGSNNSSSSSRGSVGSISTRATTAPTANSIMNAEKRMHQMKKKAAAKNAERRKI